MVFSHKIHAGMYVNIIYFCVYFSYVPAHLYSNVSWNIICISIRNWLLTLRFVVYFLMFVMCLGCIVQTKRFIVWIWEIDKPIHTNLSFLVFWGIKHWAWPYWTWAIINSWEKHFWIFYLCKVHDLIYNCMVYRRMIRVNIDNW